MPIVVELGTIQIDLRGRPAPQVVIYGTRNLERRIALADARARLITRADDALHFAELAAADELHGVFEGLARAGLRAALDDAVVLVGRVDKLPALPHTVAHGLFDVDVFAGLGCQDG